jgi:hypothetical protein
MRGLTNVSWTNLDEADFFPPGQQQDARDISEKYIAKSNPWIVMVSTPNAPEGLFERIDYLGEIILGLRLNRSYWSQKRSTILGLSSLLRII